MPVPLALAAPAAVAGLAYLNARAHVWYDFALLQCVVPMAINMFWRERTGRLNLFYDLETFANVKETADLDFLLFEDKKWTFKQGLETTLQYGTWLQQKFGIKKGDIVAMDMMNSGVFAFVWMGLWSIGARPAFINYNLTGHALVHCVKTSGSAIVLVDPKVAHNVDDYVRKELPNVCFHTLTPECKAEIASTIPVRLPDKARHENGIQNMALLIYTSGTTGLPKAAVVSWGKVHAAAGFAARLVKTKPGEVFYTSMPLYHSSGAILGFCNALLMGATIALGERFSTKTFWLEVRQHKATMIQYVGETLRYLLAALPEIDTVTGQNLDKEHHVKLALGNGLRPDVWNKFKDRFGIEYIAEFYGATEGSFATWNLSRNDFTTGAVGRNGWLYSLALSMSVAIVEVDFTTDLPYRDPKTGLCRVVKKGEPGEFLFSLPEKDLEKRFQGYYGDRDATNKKILRGVFKKGDAWFRTGDVMRWDSEGRLYFHDRIGDTFRWKSENVSTVEVSQVLGMHPAVHEANVYGVELPHHDGRAGCVALILNKEPSPDVLRSLADHVNRELPKYAAPIFLRITKEGAMQTTGTNKQQKHDLKKEGVNPEATNGDDLFWLKKGNYVRYTKTDWDELNGGRVKL